MVITGRFPSFSRIRGIYSLSHILCKVKKKIFFTQYFYTFVTQKKGNTPWYCLFRNL